MEKVRQASAEGRRIDEAERSMFAELLVIGRTLIEAFVAASGDGDCGESLEVSENSVVSSNPDTSPDPNTASSNQNTPESAATTRCLRRLPRPCSRRYVSIFGELTITRFVYGTREGQKIEAMPLDARLGLPAGEFS